MESLTSTFNAAAQGDGGQTPTDAGPDITDPGGGSASAPIEQSANTAPEATASHTYSPSKEFEYAQVDNSSPAPLEARTDKAAMIEMLEKGRAKPELNFNLRPKRALEKAVHKEVEFDREKLIAAFRATEPEPDDFAHEQNGDLDLFL